LQGHFGVFLRFALAVVDGAFRFKEGAAVGGEKAVVSMDLSRVLLCERFRDLVAGPDPAVASSVPTENESFVLTADDGIVTAATLRVRD